MLYFLVKTSCQCEDIRVKHSMGPIVNSIVDNQNVKGEQCFLERC